MLNWNNNPQEVILLITSNGFAPISPQLSDPICRAKLLTRQRSERVQPTAGNAERQMVKYNRARRPVFVQGHDPILCSLVHKQFPTRGEAAPACSSSVYTDSHVVSSVYVKTSFLLLLSILKNHVKHSVDLYFAVVNKK